MRHVLIVDDEAHILELIELTLLRMGLEVDRAMNVAEALERLQGGTHYDLCLTDMRLPDGDGLRIVEHVSQSIRDLPVAVITAHGNAENAVAALKAGAFDYLVKPVSLDQLRTLVKSALSLPQQGAGPKAAGGENALIGESQPIQHVRHLIDKVARSEAPVHVTGESGSGKELAARLIHRNGVRRDGAFIAVNCGAIPESLMESEFFGYRKGAFTGAESDRDGFFQVAHGGTLFLDEVADLPLAMQVKLLRVIQEKKVRKVGSTQEEPVDVRIISATHQNLASCVEAGRFRHDLFYRLNVIELRMPSLRDRREDVPVFAAAILERMTRSMAHGRPELDAGAMKLLQRYDFPGNVRELENILERALALCSNGRITEEDLQLRPLETAYRDSEPGAGAGAGAGGSGGGGSSGHKWPLQEFLDRTEKEAILDALEKTRFNRTAAAKLLGITFRSIRYRMERLGIE
ncbi:MAG: sigma-54-dependent transcriptional regulator [Betaproteobacteria bacterium]